MGVSSGEFLGGMLILIVVLLAVLSQFSLTVVHFVGSDGIPISGNLTVYHIVDGYDKPAGFKVVDDMSNSLLFLRRGEMYRWYAQSLDHYTQSDVLVACGFCIRPEEVTLFLYPDDLQVVADDYHSILNLSFTTKNALLDMTICTSQNVTFKDGTVFHPVSQRMSKFTQCTLQGSLVAGTKSVLISHPNMTELNLTILDREKIFYKNGTDWDYFYSDSQGEDIGIKDLSTTIIFLPHNVTG